MQTATIIGGGISGAASAVGLARAGWHVTVHERADRLETSGAALGIWPTALTALDELGLGEQVRSVATPQGSGVLRRPDGSRIATIDADRVSRRAGDVVHLVARRDLAAILDAALPAGAVRYGSPVRADGRESRASDVVVVADGVFSANRSLLLGDRFQARRTGQTAFRGRVAVMTHEVSETWGAGRRVGLSPYRDGTTNWYASVDQAPARGRPGEAEWLRGCFAGWHEPIGEVLGELDDHDVSRHDLYDVHPRLPTYAAGHAVMVGDAARGMTPDLGRGACEALVDAVTLSRCLSGGRAKGERGEAVDVGRALARYDATRRPVTQRLQAASYGLGRLAHARRMTVLRDVAVRAALSS
ncbi:FAD-dependent monooxygenase [Isoptericola halotolerans]|uniref:2-polyprenyl-6-methoxyphenol hydroxylase-like FAD-dependent oxidoreductase n=1 Tax=Isoptericola halotolerans TaxID=300560 RepID=A0ABX2A5V0_9MICO|nr:FAD-dependent oxidoreductase [Isoptericola halotolerans]NOV98031.1 2-polyprenyl-6-methoxyphenol hydroxylase-like FAD-dependent oxidoreductase [Isoptericola halotolerans]